MVGRRRSRTVVAGTLGLLVAGLLGGASTAFGASTTVNLDQWASSDGAWQNGNLNGHNSRYPEGGIVPFRLAIEGLKAGNHSIHINHDFTAGGHKAYDFLATWNVTNAKGRICAGSGGAVSSMCPDLPAPSSFAFPSDPYVANGLSVRGAEVYSGAPRRLTIWGGTITSISRPAHAGSPNGNSTADLLVRFRSTGKAVLLAWGGHLAQSAYWDVADGGPPDGAAQVSGAPWHMRTLQLDGTGNKNQDRSIQPSAIVGDLPPQALAPTPSPTAQPPVPAANPPATTPRPTAPGAPDPPDGGSTGGPAAPGGTPFPDLTPPATATLDAAPVAPATVSATVVLALIATLAVVVGGLRRITVPTRHRRRP